MEIDMRTVAVFDMTLFPLVFASGNEAKDKAVKGELEKLRGNWKQVSVEVGGNKQVLPDGLAATITIDGTTWTAELPKGKVETIFTIDPTKDPKTWDRNRKNDAKKDVVDRCIYKLDGDTLTICSGHTPTQGKEVDGAAERPKNFETTDGGVIFVYKRVKSQ